MSATAGRSGGAGGERGEDQGRVGMEAKVRGAGSDRRQRVGVAPAAIWLRKKKGDCFDREYVSPTAAAAGEDSAPSARLSVSGWLPAPVRQAGAGAVESVRPCRAAEPLEHRAERHDRG